MATSFLKYFILPGLIIASLSSLGQSQTATITFIMTSTDLPDTTKVFITGSHQQLGNWNPSRVMMQSAGNHTWTKKISVNAPVSLEYKFTLGSWGRQPADVNGNEYHNFDVSIHADTTVNHSIFYWTTEQRDKVIKGKITGTVTYHKQLKGEGIAPRDIIVWLPPGYAVNNGKRYPVVYMHDGQNIVDPATSSFGVDWQIDETSDSLIQNKITEPYIVVGIYNTVDRTKEYTPGDKGTAYMKFIVHTLKPMIDAAYRTMPDRKHTIAGGSSAGGIISFMMVWEYPQVFSKAICMSPAFKIQDVDYVKTVIDSKRRKNVYFYIDNGGVGLESELQPGIDDMMTALKQKGYKEGKDYFYYIDPKAKHSESDWAMRFPGAVKRCLNH